MACKPQLAGLAHPLLPAYAAGQVGINYSGKEGLMIPRGKDNKAKDDGQWGTSIPLAG